MTLAVGRLAPTPSGRLHLGNLTAFAAAWLSVRQAGGELVLRVEDVDQGRARQEIEDSLREDLLWMGLTWDRETPRQSARDYQPALNLLRDRLYRCTCTRRELAARGGRCGCAHASHTEGAVRFRLAPGPRRVEDRAWGVREVPPDAMVDPTLVRRDGVPTYSLAVVWDDLCDGVTEVVRGADLLEFSGVQAQLWEALGGREPSWLHAPLILGPDGRKLSKSHGALELAAMRAAGWEPARLWPIVLSWLGLRAEGLEAAIPRFRPSGVPRAAVQLERLAPQALRWRWAEVTVGEG
ncbi:MAG: tRNA glutamyl-Q(34) synthetase GluQRS [Deltaproteobacteria bacterium]|nr:tRNA glutamyl-Q(34) synthetase GluQRS [Deltaproteobacteria bacterium]